jgi:hypothetical protein
MGVAIRARALDHRFGRRNGAEGSSEKSVVSHKERRRRDVKVMQDVTQVPVAAVHVG